MKRSRQATVALLVLAQTAWCGCGTNARLVDLSAEHASSVLPHCSDPIPGHVVCISRTCLKTRMSEWEREREKGDLRLLESAHGERLAELVRNIEIFSSVASNEILESQGETTSCALELRETVLSAPEGGFECMTGLATAVVTGLILIYVLIYTVYVIANGRCYEEHGPPVHVEYELVFRDTHGTELASFKTSQIYKVEEQRSGCGQLGRPRFHYPGSCGPDSVALDIAFDRAANILLSKLLADPEALERLRFAEAPAPKLCASCNARLEANAHYCPYCGSAK